MLLIKLKLIIEVGESDYWKAGFNMREWESDPLFAAAEVVQDSADRMESIYRHLLHEQSVVQGDHLNGKLQSSIEYHRRDLATILETAKWQLEDFEREVSVSGRADKSRVKQNVIVRHMQFIKAIREQISLVEQSMSTSLGNSLRTMNLNEQDKDGLAMFLLGGKPVKHIADQEPEDNIALRKFLDPAMSSSSKEDTNEDKGGEILRLNMNEIAYLEHNSEVNGNFQTNMDLGTSSSFQGDNYGRFDEEGNCDLEASEAQSITYLQKNNLRDYRGRMSMFGSLKIFLSTNGRRASRSFMKRLKDGEEQRQYLLSGNAHHGMQRYLARLRLVFGCSNFHLPCSQLSAGAMQSSNWIRDHRENCTRYLHRIQVRNHPVISILALLLILLILSTLVS